MLGCSDSVNFCLRDCRAIKVWLALSMAVHGSGLDSNATNDTDKDSQRDVKIVVD